jgi:hypothetical protein
VKAATLHWYRTASDASPTGFELRAEHRGRTWRMYRLADSSWRVRPTDRPQKEATFRTPEEARKWASQQAALNPRSSRYARNPQRGTDRTATFHKGQKVALRRPIQPAAAGSVFVVEAVDTKRWKIPRYRLPVGWVSQRDLMAATQKNPETTMARQNPERTKDFYRRNLILPDRAGDDGPKVIDTLYAWHGGQFTGVYSLASTGDHDYVSASMIDRALTELRADVKKAKGKDKKELKEVIGELQMVIDFPNEFTVKAATGDDVDSGYDTYGMKQDDFEGNPRSTEVDEHAANELELYIDNDEPLYRQWQAIVRNLWKHQKRGRYDSERAADGFMYLVDAGAKKYVKEFGDLEDVTLPRATKWNVMFDMPTRRAVAREYAKSFENNYRDEISYAPEGLRHNPDSDVFRNFATPDGTEVLWISASEAYVLVSDQGALLSREILLVAATPDELDAALREYNPRKKNPDRRKNGAGLGALIGSTIGAVLGLGVSSVPLAALGSLAGGAVGGYIGAPKDRKKRGAAGGAIGGAVLGPIGAGVGGYIGGRKPDRDYGGRRNNPEKYQPRKRGRMDARREKRIREELGWSVQDAAHAVEGMQIMNDRGWQYGWEDDYDPDTQEKINRVVLLDENEEVIAYDWDFTFSDIGQAATAGMLAYHHAKQPNPSFPHIDAIEVIDTLNDQQILYHRADEKGRERFEKALAKYGNRDRYVVQGLLNDGTIVIDNQGIGGEVRILRNPNSCGCSHRTTSISRRVANP